MAAYLLRAGFPPAVSGVFTAPTLKPLEESSVYIDSSYADSKAVKPTDTIILYDGDTNLRAIVTAADGLVHLEGAPRKYDAVLKVRCEAVAENGPSLKEAVGKYVSKQSHYGAHLMSKL